MPQHDNTAGRSVYDDVRDVREAMADNLAGENARLRRDLGDSRDLLQAKDAAIDDLGGQVERLQARLDTATAHVEELRGQRDEQRARAEGALGKSELLYQRFAAVRAERDAMRPVVDAAEAWADNVKNVNREHFHPLEWEIKAAVDAWRAAQPDVTAPSDRLSATQADEQGADDGADTEGSRAQGGAQGGPYRCAVCGWPYNSTDYCACPPPAPADPAGLDVAIEAARRSAHGVIWLDDAGQDQTIRIAVRAAAPHLRAAALNEAADEIERDWSGEFSFEAAIQWLRERAGREATS